MIYRFADFEVDPVRFRLTRNGEPTALEPRVFEMLVYLVEHRDRLVGRDEILEAVWMRRFFGKGLLSQSVYAARQALGDDPRSPRFIETVRGRGFRFVAEVEVIPADNAGNGKQAAPVSPALSGGPAVRRHRWMPAAAAALAAVVVTAALISLGPRTNSRLLSESVAFLPLVNATGDEDLSWVELGLTDMMARSLDRNGGVEVIPSTQVIAAFQRRGNTSSPANAVGRDDAVGLARELGARWVVTGVFSRERNLFRLRATLHDTRAGSTGLQFSGTEPLVLADDLNRVVARRVGARSIPQPLGERYSRDPFVQRTFATGMQAQIHGSPREAQRYFEMCLEREPGFGWARYELALAQRKLGDRETSRRLTEEVLAAARAGDEGELAAAALNNLGVLAWARNDLSMAEEHLSEALAFHREVDLKRGEASNLVNLGILASQRSEWEPARERYQAALSLYRELGDGSGEAAAYNSLGVLAWRRGEVDLSEAMHTQALEIRRRLGLRSHEAASLNNLGTIAHARGELGRAEEYFSQALAMRRDMEDREGAASTLSNLALVAVDRGRLDEAERRLLETIELFRELTRPDKEAQAVAHLMAVAIERRDQAAAHRLGRESLRLSRELGDRAASAAALATLADLAAQAGDLAQARASLAEAVLIAAETSNPATTAALARAQGRVALASGDSAAAETHFRRSLDITRAMGLGRGHLAVTADLAAILAATGRRREASDLFDALPGRWQESERAARLRHSIFGSDVPDSPQSEASQPGRRSAGGPQKEGSPVFAAGGARPPAQP